MCAIFQNKVAELIFFFLSKLQILKSFSAHYLIITEHLVIILVLHSWHPFSSQTRYIVWYLESIFKWTWSYEVCVELCSSQVDCVLLKWNGKEKAFEPSSVSGADLAMKQAEIVSWRGTLGTFWRGGKTVNSMPPPSHHFTGCSSLLLIYWRNCWKG